MIMNARKGRIDEISKGAQEGPRYLRAVRSGIGGLIEASAALDTILVANDFSNHAANAVNRVALLADEINVSKVTMLHVFEEPRLIPFRQISSAPPNVNGRRIENAKRQLEAIADQLRLRTSLRVESRVEVGNVVTAIQCFATPVGLLVLGAQGSHPLRDFALGSTAQRVLRKTFVPVLVVRRRAEAHYRQVLVAVDFQSDARCALEYAQALAPQARLNLVHVYRFPFERKMRYSGVPDDLIGFYRAEARAAASRCMRELVSSRVSSNAVNPLIVHGDAVATLLDKERELNADLIVLTRRNKSLTEELLLESVTLKLLERSRCDVLVMN